MSATSDSDDPRAGDISAWRAINTTKSARRAIVMDDETHGPVEYVATRVESSPFLDQDDVRVQVEPPPGFDPADFEDLTHLADVVAEVRSQSAGLYKVAFEDGHVDKVRASLRFTNCLLTSLRYGRPLSSDLHLA